MNPNEMIEYRHPNPNKSVEVFCNPLLSLKFLSSVTIHSAHLASLSDRQAHRYLINILDQMPSHVHHLHPCKNSPLFGQYTEKAGSLYR